jgi:Suppressor of fused protein (SUFU)
MSNVAADALVEAAGELFRSERYGDAAEKYERATQVFPLHSLAWKGLGHARLCLGQLHQSAQAFDRAIGLRSNSATALWGGAVAHAEIGNKSVAQNYLRRALALQPTWIEMARSVPLFTPFLQVSTQAADALRTRLGMFSTWTYRHAHLGSGTVDVARFVDRPEVGLWTYATVGLSNTRWPELGRPRVELVLATSVDTEICGQILANLAFHLADTHYFPEPGLMVRDVIGGLAAGDLSGRLPNIYIQVPRAWRLSLPICDGPPPITLAQVIPVSEAEYRVWHGDPAGFEQALARRNVDLTDLGRRADH